MKTIKYMGMALIMAALASCSSDDDFGTNWQNDPTAVRVSATVGGVFTRSNPTATTEAEQKKFNEGDAITISTEGQTSVNYILKDGTWGPETSGQFLKWSSESMTFTARYPKTSGDFIVPKNQNGIDEIASADYMTATKVYNKIPANRKVDFLFERQMARVVITIAGFNNEFSDKASVSEMYVTSKERIAKDGSAVTATSDIIPSQSRYGKKGSIYYALVAPNTATNYEFIKLRVKYESDVKSLTVKNPVALEARKSYNFNLTIGKNGVSLGTVLVEDWGNTGTISGGEASIDLIDLSKGNINITSDGYYVITTNGVTTANTITINSNATVQLKNAIISTSDIGIDVKSGSPTIIVSGTENSVTSTTATAINVCDGATLTIKGENGTNDKLTAKGGSTSTNTNGSHSTAGAGIGSSDGGNIVIENVSIEATGGTGNQTVTLYYSGGAGIGSSSSAHCGDITISNAVITASGGKGAPGIGMGAGKSASAPTMGNINIKSSTITATGGLYASAIGFPNVSCFDIPKTLIGGTINIETEESSETFLSRLTCDLGSIQNMTEPIYKIGKGSQSISFYKGLDGGEWPGVVLKASDQTLTSTDGIGALKQ